MKTRVLIVEDHQMTLVGLKMLLEKKQSVDVVGEASNGMEAVQLAASAQPEVILMGAMICDTSPKPPRGNATWKPWPTWNGWNTFASNARPLSAP